MVKVLFDHIPKCGGTTVTTNAIKIFGREKVSPHLQRSTMFFVEAFLKRYDFVAGHFTGRIFYKTRPDLHYVTLLRDPVERIISSYYYVRDIRLQDGADKRTLQDMSLDEFVLSTPKNRLTHILGQRLPDDQPNQSKLKHALANLELYDVIGLTEDMPRFIAQVGELVGRSVSDTDADHVARKNPQRPSIADLGESTRSLISERNNLDLKLYERAKELSVSLRSPEARKYRAGRLRRADRLTSRVKKPADRVEIDLLSLNGRSSRDAYVEPGERVHIKLRITSKLDFDIRFFASFTARIGGQNLGLWLHPHKQFISKKQTMVLSAGASQIIDVALQVPVLFVPLEVDVIASLLAEDSPRKSPILAKREGFVRVFCRADPFTYGDSSVLLSWSSRDGDDSG